MAIQIKLKNSVVQDSTPSTSDLPAVGEIALNANINSIGGFMRASDNTIVKIFGPGSLSTPTATTTVSGISELATNSETTTGTATNRVVTPAGLNAVTVAERSTSNSTYLALAGGTLTGVVAATAGSNSAPSIHFGDSDSGIFGGTNTVSLAAGGTTRLTADTGVSVVGTLAVTGAITSTSDLTIPDKIIHSGDTDTAIRFPAADTVSVETGGNEAIRINDSGQVLVGVSSTRTMFTGYTPSLQVEGNAKSDSASSLVVNNASTVGPTLWFGKTRGTSVGSNTVVQSGDELGTIFFNGADGTDVQSIAASIRSEVDGTPGSNDMPGRLVFSTTADGAASPTERLRIDNTGLSTFTGNLTTTGIQTANSSNSGKFVRMYGSSGTGRWDIYGNGANLRISDNDSAGAVVIDTNLDVGAGIDVTGNSTFSGTGTNALEINGTGGHELYSYHDSGGVGWATGAGGSYGELLYLDESGSAVKLYAGGSLRLSANSSGATVTGNIAVSGTVDAVDGDFDGTLEADAITVGGVALNTVIAGVTVTNATNAANITAADESSDTTCFPVFVTAATGNLAPKTGSNLSFNSSSGVLTATSFAGDGSNLTGVSSVGGNTGVKFNDDVNITLGTGNDTLIRHVAGSHTEINHVGSGDLILETVNGGDDIMLDSNDDIFLNHAGESMVVCRSDAQVELYYDNSKKLETTSTGVSVTGDLVPEANDTRALGTGSLQWAQSNIRELKVYEKSTHYDNVKAVFGHGEDLQIFHDGTENAIDMTNTLANLRIFGVSGSHIKLEPRDGHSSAVFKSNNAVELYYDNSKKLSTISGGVQIHGNLAIQDGYQLRLGNDNDAQFYHSGSNCILSNSTGLFYLGNYSNTNLIFQTNNTNRWYIRNDGHFIPDANNTVDIGTSSTRVRNIYTNDLNLSNEGSSNDVDATWGSYTIQEGAEDLFLINRRSGKKYKFNLTEVA
jgi:hypothetical protein